MSAPTPRSDGRPDHALRPVSFERGWLDAAEGSCLVTFGRTRVLCVASFTAGVPRWKKGSGEGWATAEYAMLPRSTTTRSDIDTAALGENTIVLDCDVLQADGGTRTAAITGAYVALADAVTWAVGQGLVPATARVLTNSVAAVSVGLIDGVPRLDLHYDDDVRADTDMNVVMTGSGDFVEVQGTAEGVPFDRALLDQLLDLAAGGIAELTRLQVEALAQPLPERS